MDLIFQGETSVQAKRRLEAGYKARRNKRVAQLLAMIVRATPVDTGLARGGWRVGMTEVEWPTGTPDKDGDLTIAMGEAALAKIHHFSNVSISNGEFHIGSLERGHSGQAPNGMVRVSVSAFRAMNGDVS